MSQLESDQMNPDQLQPEVDQVEILTKSEYPLGPHDQIPPSLLPREPIHVSAGAWAVHRVKNPGDVKVSEFHPELLPILEFNAFGQFEDGKNEETAELTDSDRTVQACIAILNAILGRAQIGNAPLLLQEINLMRLAIWHEALIMSGEADGFIPASITPSLGAFLEMWLGVKMMQAAQQLHIARQMEKAGLAGQGEPGKLVRASGIPISREERRRMEREARRS